MKVYIIAGSAEDEKLTECEYLSQVLQNSAPSVHVKVVHKHKSEWKKFAENLCRSYGWEIVTYSPIIWTSEGEFIGNDKRFKQLITDLYNVRVPFDPKDIKKRTSANIENTENEKQRKESGQSIKELATEAWNRASSFQALQIQSGIYEPVIDQGLQFYVKRYPHRDIKKKMFMDEQILPNQFCLRSLQNDGYNFPILPPSPKSKTMTRSFRSGNKSRSPSNHSPISDKSNKSKASNKSQQRSKGGRSHKSRSRTPSPVLVSKMTKEISSRVQDYNDTMIKSQEEFMKELERKQQQKEKLEKEKKRKEEMRKKQELAKKQEKTPEKEQSQNKGSIAKSPSQKSEAKSQISEAGRKSNKSGEAATPKSVLNQSRQEQSISQSQLGKSQEDQTDPSPEFIDFIEIKDIWTVQKLTEEFYLCAHPCAIVEPMFAIFPIQDGGAGDFSSVKDIRWLDLYKDYGQTRKTEYDIPQTQPFQVPYSLYKDRPHTYMLRADEQNQSRDLRAVKHLLSQTEWKIWLSMVRELDMIGGWCKFPYGVTVQQQFQYPFSSLTMCLYPYENSLLQKLDELDQNLKNENIPRSFKLETFQFQHIFFKIKENETGELLEVQYLDLISQLEQLEPWHGCVLLLHSKYLLIIPCKLPLEPSNILGYQQIPNEIIGWPYTVIDKPDITALERLKQSLILYQQEEPEEVQPDNKNYPSQSTERPKSSEGEEKNAQEMVKEEQEEK